MACATLQMTCTTLQMTCATLPLACATLQMTCATLPLACATLQMSCATLPLACATLQMSCTTLPLSSDVLRHYLLGMRQCELKLFIMLSMAAERECWVGLGKKWRSGSARARRRIRGVGGCNKDSITPSEEEDEGRNIPVQVIDLEEIHAREEIMELEGKKTETHPGATQGEQREASKESGEEEKKVEKERKRAVKGKNDNQLRKEESRGQKRKAENADDVSSKKPKLNGSRNANVTGKRHR
ncbi:hypothetical protein BT96DRAFT_1096569 [Gymnopus androsaceus JB14]|uniref:Uncharacterized protein n=1 Tax=Gymnopus androsaceus JB14 TaxID=1447944 RepID=A0A6A4GH08_9AGAR|nr:hypothetical protein BT96DRAFT_1096569 [Gymnopus androsaceus JB14]